MSRLVLVSAVALVDVDGRVLIGQRPEGKTLAGLWEFPGGKVEDGETPEEALLRGMDQARQQDWPAAVEAFRKAVALDPESVEPRFRSRE